MIHRSTVDGVLKAILLVSLVGSAFGSDFKPYREFIKDGVGFYGREFHRVDLDTLSSVRIGLLVSPVGVGPGAMRAGVEMAVDEANSRGGYRGIPYQVVYRSDTGPWGIAAKQIVAFIYDKNVWAILGGLDGHRTHLAELVSAKAWIPVISPTACDMTVDYANVPWVFRCLPDDGKQAEKLLHYAVERGFKRVLFLYEGTRVGQTAWDRYREIANRKKFYPVQALEYNPLRPGDIVTRLRPGSFDAVVVWGKPDGVLKLLAELRKLPVDVPVLGPASLATPDFARRAEGLGFDEVVAAAAFAWRDGDPGLEDFYRRYRARTGKEPHPFAVFGYDAANMLIKAIEKAGLSRAEIRNALAGMEYNGLAGRFRFDSLGGNVMEPVLVRLQAGRWMEVNEFKAQIIGDE